MAGITETVILSSQQYPNGRKFADAIKHDLKSACPTTRWLQFRFPDARIVGTAEIPNYQLLFKGSKTGSYLTIEPKQGCTVPAAVWSVSERDELALDRYEGCTIPLKVLCQLTEGYTTCP